MKSTSEIGCVHAAERDGVSGESHAKQGKLQLNELKLTLKFGGADGGAAAADKRLQVHHHTSGRHTGIKNKQLSQTTYVNRHLLHIGWRVLTISQPERALISWLIYAALI